MAWVTEFAPTPSELSACVQCGLCLPECPTFRLTGKETFSPRGRLMAMSAVADGVVPMDDAFGAILGSCLQCRACEVVCPSLVPFGRAMEGARIELAAQSPPRSQAVRHFFVGRVLASRMLLRVMTVGARVARQTAVGKFLPKMMAKGLAGVRPLDQKPIQRGVTHRAIGERLGQAGFLAGCVMDVWFSPVHVASIELLRRCGYDVIVPDNQTCCGALAAHDGDAKSAERLASVNVAAFSDVDLLVVDSAGCGAHLKEYEHWAGEPGASLSTKVRDVTEVVAEAITNGRLPISSSRRGRVAVQDPCHLRHVQRIIAEPRQIIAAAGYEPVEIDPDGRCCGAAGIYSLLQPELSAQLGENKAKQVRTVEASIVASANPGCEMQLRSYLGEGYTVVHPVELLWNAVVEDGR